MKRILALSAMLALSACATFGSAPVYGDVPECEKLIPPQLKDAVPGVTIPETEDAQAWMQAFLGQTGALDKANDRTASVDYIYKTCLQLHRDALAKAKRGFFGRLFG